MAASRIPSWQVWVGRDEVPVLEEGNKELAGLLSLPYYIQSKLQGTRMTDKHEVLSSANGLHQVGITGPL